MKDILILALLLSGAGFILISALGIIRMPDIYLRMSSSSKASTLGVGLVMLAAALHFSDELGVATRAVSIIFFLLLTTPVAAHMIGRAAYYHGIPLWQQTHFDELKGKHNPHNQTVAGITPPDSEPTPPPSSQRFG